MFVFIHNGQNIDAYRMRVCVHLGPSIHGRLLGAWPTRYSTLSSVTKVPHVLVLLLLLHCVSLMQDSGVVGLSTFENHDEPRSRGRGRGRKGGKSSQGVTERGRRYSMMVGASPCWIDAVAPKDEESIKIKNFNPTPRNCPVTAAGYHCIRFDEMSSSETVGEYSRGYIFTLSLLDRP